MNTFERVNHNSNERAIRVCLQFSWRGLRYEVSDRALPRLPLVEIDLSGRGVVDALDAEAGAVPMDAERLLHRFWPEPRGCHPISSPCARMAASRSFCLVICRVASRRAPSP